MQKDWREWRDSERKELEVVEVLVSGGHNHYQDPSRRVIEQDVGEIPGAS